MQKEEDNYKPPESTAGDAAHAVMRAGLGTIPFAGSAATELLNAIVLPPLEKRRREWMEQVGRALRKIEEEMGIVLERLQENERFIDTALEATMIAMRTSNHEKRGALKNAILNSAFPDAPEEVYQQIYLALVDDLSTLHVKVLREMEGIIMGTTADMFLNQIFSDFQVQKSLYLHVWNDLVARNLIRIVKNAAFSTNISRTELGAGFIQFISEPVRKTAKQP